MKILHLYHDLMNLYGDYGNICALKRCLEQKGEVVELCRASVGDEFDFSDCDFIFIGSGTERNQKVMLENIKEYSASLKTAVADRTILFAAGNSFEIFGAAVTDADGTIYKGLCWYDYLTEESRERIVVDVNASCRLVGGEVIGFINKCSQTKEIKSPMFEIADGNGNSRDDKNEGIADGNFYGTHIIGPVLVRNPKLCEYFADLLIGRKSAGG